MSNNVNNNLVSDTVENVIYPASRSEQEFGQAKETTVKATETPYINQSQEKISEGIREAKVKASEMSTQTGQATDQFEKAMSAKTDQAVAEGRHDVNEAKATGTGYVQQAKQTISDVANAAQDYVSVGLDEHTPVDPHAQQDPSLVSSLQSAANTAYEKGKSYLAAAQETAEPHVRKVQETVQPHAESLIEAAKPYVNKAQSAISSALGTGTNSKPEENGKDDTPNV